MAVPTISQSPLTRIFEHITCVAEEAIQWFNVVRHVDYLSMTQFTFYVDRSLDGYEFVTTEFSVERVGGSAYDTVCKYFRTLDSEEEGQIQEALNSVFSERDPRFDEEAVALESMDEEEEIEREFPREPTASLPIDRIIRVHELTEEIFQDLSRPISQDIRSICLEVGLFDFQEQIITRAVWTVPL